MKCKTILVYCFALLVFSTSHTQACEVCGCSLGGFNFGIIPQTENHFFGMKFSRSRFYAEMNHANHEAEYSNDTYFRLDFMGRIAVTDRLQVNVILPYLSNNMEGSLEQSKVVGLGDPIALMNYKLVSQKATAENQWLHNFWAGIGIKAPVGNFNYSQTEQLINPNFQLGTGSWDYLFTGNYIISRNRWGMNMESTYKLNSINSQRYRFGNQFNAHTNLFYTIPNLKFQVIPYGGGYLERGGMHTFEGFQEVNSGGTAFFANTGVQVEGKHILFNVAYQQPLSQQFNSDENVTIRAHGRFSITLLAFIIKDSGKEKLFIMK